MWLLIYWKYFLNIFLCKDILYYVLTRYFFLFQQVNKNEKIVFLKIISLLHSEAYVKPKFLSKQINKSILKNN